MRSSCDVLLVPIVQKSTVQVPTIYHTEYDYSAVVSHILIFLNEYEFYLFILIHRWNQLYGLHDKQVFIYPALLLFKHCIFSQGIWCWTAAHG